MPAMNSEQAVARGEPSFRAAGVPVPVLMYHSVSDAPATTTRALSVQPAAFAAQLSYLRRHGFTGLTFGELGHRRRTGQPLPARPIVITFDDGYADLVDEALPILLEHAFPATVFVTTGWLHDAGRYAAGAAPGRMLSWAQLPQLSAAGVEVAAHGHSHAQLDQISETRLRAELSDCKQLLEERLGHPVCSLAYPYGYLNKRVRTVAREIGYLQAAAVANTTAASGCDIFSVPRLTVRRSTSLPTFSRTVNGRRTRLHYAPSRALTAGWAVVRRTQSVLRTLPRELSNSATGIEGVQ
jgi:peptidoglycan/xylan/chitin deacetylase (PgdA/CDA1 family)